MNRFLVFVCCIVAANSSQADLPAGCPPAKGIAVQVLGSGGPIADDARSSTSYAIWVDGKSRALIDVGSGSFVRLGEAGVRFPDLDFIGLSHFHTDHAADFVALLKSGLFSGRDRPLPVAGPSGNNRFPGLNDFLAANLDSKTGAYRYLGGYLDGTGGLVRLLPSEVGSDAEPENLLENSGSELAVYATHVPHGVVPALGYRVDIRGKTIVFASDQNGSDPAFAEFARDSDLLVMHLVIPEGAPEAARQLHAEPSRIGQIGAAADADRLLLSHFMARSLADLEGNVAVVADTYGRDLLTATDLFCVTVD